MFRRNLANMLCGLLGMLLLAISPAAWSAEEEAPAPAKPAQAVPAEDPVSDAPADKPAEATPAEEKKPADKNAKEGKDAEATQESKGDQKTKVEQAKAKMLAPQNPDQIIQKFMENVEKREDISAEQRAEIKKQVDSLKDDPYSRDVIVTLVQRELSPDFSAALDHLVNEDLPSAQTVLTKLTESKDPYLAAESSFYLARSYIMEDRYEEALPHLQAIGDRWSQHTLHSPESLFLRGVSEIRVLKRKEASASLSAFLKQYPNASERMKIAAFRMLDLLEQTEEGSLRDVQTLMEYSRRRLTLEVPDKKTQEAQEKAVALLEKLIEKAEEQESKGQGKGKGEKKEQSKSQGNNQSESEGQGSPSQSTSGQGGSNQNDQSPDKVVRELRGGPKTPWDHLRNKQREEKAFAALKAKFPNRYQRLVEQYFRSFQEDKE